MKIVSYNINGIRASLRLGILDWIKEFNADVYCFQEVKCNESLTQELLFPSHQINLFETVPENLLEGYYPIYNCGSRAGYAGTMFLSKIKPDKIFYGMGEFWQDDEGRTTTIVLGDYAIVNTYVPNGSSRLEFKMLYLEALHKYLKELQRSYKVICVGDFNIAHNEIDLTNPKECRNKSVFLPIERQMISKLLNLNIIDCFRFINPNLVKYSWRSYRSRQEKGYQGWQYRIDYILASESVKNQLKNCDILELNYSDHLPVVAELEI